jgi:hypothetical protein
MGRVHDRGPLAETARTRQELDRPAAVLGEALLDLLRLLVCMDVEDEALPLGVSRDLLEPVSGARAHRMRCDAQRDSPLAQRVDLREVVEHRALPEAGETPARVGDVQEDELDARSSGGVDRRECLLEPEIVELSDRGEPGRAHLSIHGLVGGADELRSLALRLGQHRVAPRPEVGSCRPATQGALERVTVRVDEAWQGERVVGHEEATLPPTSAPSGNTVDRSWSSIT